MGQVNLTVRGMRKSELVIEEEGKQLRTLSDHERGRETDTNYNTGQEIQLKTLRKQREIKLFELLLMMLTH